MTTNVLSKLGRFPIAGPEARDKKQMVVIKPADSLKLIHGDDNHVLVSFYVSNDFIHTGKIVIPANKLSDHETHQGDEVFYVTKGTISVLITEEKEAQKSVSNKRFAIGTGERFFIPAGVTHQYFNFSDNVGEIVFSIAPNL